MASLRRLVRAIQDDDEATIGTLLRVSRSHRIFAPLAFAVGAFAMVLDGLKVLLANWRLTLIQLLPAVWIWLAMYDLKAHALHGKSLNVLRGPILIPINLVIIAITAASFFLNAVFAFSIAGPRPPAIRPALATARSHLGPILASGAIAGALLGVATTIVTRAGKPWFTLCLGVIVGGLMVCYVAVPSRLIGVKKAASRRDRWTASALLAAVSTTVCTPPYMLGRLGILMLGSRVLLIPGIVVLTVGFALQAGATGAVRAIKLSTVLAAGISVMTPEPETGADPRPEAATEARMETGTDARPEAAADSRPEAAADSRPEAATEARLEAGTEARLEAGTDARLEAGTDARLEAGTEARLEAGTDARLESQPGD